MLAFTQVLFFEIAVILVLHPTSATCTARYYGSYQSYGTGDMFIDTPHAHGGSKSVDRKWNVECLDGQAAVGVRDNTDDFQRIFTLWCKFIFPYKWSTRGLYPYYSSCHIRSIRNQSFCFDPDHATLTMDTFITGIWSKDSPFRLDRRDEGETLSYKCCRTPVGYFIDYISCVYKPTHDQYWEYYDALQFLVFCDAGFVMTGMYRRVNPWDEENHLEWIQCCRVGFANPYLYPMFYGFPKKHAGYGRSQLQDSSLALESSLDRLPKGKTLCDYNTATRYNM